MSTRPSRASISDVQRENFDKGEPFYAEFVFQLHLSDKAAIDIREARLLDDKNEYICSLMVDGERSFTISSRGSYRNGEEEARSVAFSLPAGLNPDRYKKYQIQLFSGAKTLSDDDQIPLVVLPEFPTNLSVEPSVKTRSDNMRIERLRILGWLSFTISILFSGAILVFWRLRGRSSHGYARRVIRRVFINPLKFWVFGFIALATLFLFVGYGLTPAVFHPWITLGLALLLVLFLKSLEVRMGKEPSGIQLSFYCLDSILGSVIVALITRTTIK